MAFPGLHNNQAVVLGGKIKVNLFHHRVRRILEINGYQPPYGAGHLVQQAGGLIPVHILGIFPDMRIGHRVDRASVKEGIYHRTDQHLKRCR